MRKQIAAGIAAAFILAASAQAEDHGHDINAKPPVPSAKAVRELKPALLKGLTDHNGKSVDENTFTNKNLVVFFGFTSCPTICPVGMNTIANTMASIEKRYGTNAANCIMPVFITTDPENDTPEKMKRWLGMFDKDAIGLTGTAEQLAEIGRKFRAINLNGGHHSPFAYIFDKSGLFKGIVDTQRGPQSMLNALVIHLNPGNEAFCAPPAPR